MAFPPPKQPHTYKGHLANQRPKTVVSKAKPAVSFGNRPTPAPRKPGMPPGAC